MSDSKHVCIDRLPPSGAARADSRANAGMEAAFFWRKLWPNGSRLRVRFLGGTPGQRALAMQQAAWWSEHANLTFVESNDPDAEIRVSFDPGDGAWSYLGTDCQGIPRNEATMNLGFLDGGTAGHEFGHAIGLGHEHQNPAGGIEWNEAEVIRDLSGPPNNWSAEQARHNVIEKYKADQIRGSAFDPASIMLYFFPGSWTRSGLGTHANETLSATDKDFAARVYPRGAQQGPRKLEVNAAPVAERIGKPGEEDLFSFSVGATAPHVVETSGDTDLVMKLFGPNSRTALVAEDDDSGPGRNPRIAERLAPGEYVVQVRHFNRRRGTGEYGIRINR